jgi:hypothetical protein
MAPIDPFDTHPKTSQSVCNKPPTATPFDLSIPIDSANFMSGRCARFGPPLLLTRNGAPPLPLMSLTDKILSQKSGNSSEISIDKTGRLIYNTA